MSVVKLFSIRLKDDYHSIEEHEALSFCFISHFFLVHAEDLASVMYPAEKALESYTYMPIVLAETIMRLDGLNDNPLNDYKGSPVPLQVRLQFWVFLMLFFSCGD